MTVRSIGVRSAVLVLVAVSALAGCSSSGDGGSEAGATATGASQRTASTTPGSTAAPSPTPTPTTDAAPTAVTSSAAGAPTAGGWWGPAPGATWQYQLSGTLDTSVDVDVVDADWQETTAAQVDAVHAGGGRMVCYVNAGAYEEWRPDAASYPAAVLGEPLDGWPGERWLDVRATDALLPIIAARMDVCSSKGFDAVETDNVDGWANDTGFDLSPSDQLTFNRALADLAHARGMGIGLKNDVEQVGELASSFDFAVNEECMAYDECGAYTAFTGSGKAVLHVEYEGLSADLCAAGASLGLSTIGKELELGAGLQSC